MSERIKYSWSYDNGTKITAAGILVYDDKGIWTVGEKNKRGDIEYVDIGGSYNFADCHPARTIIRELSEETYNTCELSYDRMKDIMSRYPPTFVNGTNGRPTYACYVIPSFEVKEIVFSPIKFQIARTEAINNNVDVPSLYYKQVDMKYIPFEKIAETKIGFRLQIILKHGPLSENIRQISQLDAEQYLPRHCTSIIKSDKLKPIPFHLLRGKTPSTKL